MDSLNSLENVTICSLDNPASVEDPICSYFVFVHSSNYYMNGGILLYPYSCLLILSSFEYI